MASPNTNVPFRKIQRELKDAGFAQKGQQRGSHQVWRAPDDQESVVLIVRTGRDAGPKNVHLVRKAIERYAEREALRLRLREERPPVAEEDEEDIQPLEAPFDAALYDSHLFHKAALDGRGALHLFTQIPESSWLTGLGHPSLLDKLAEVPDAKLRKTLGLLFRTWNTDGTIRVFFGELKGLTGTRAQGGSPVIAAHLFYEGPLVPAATARGEPFKLDGYRVEPQLKEGVVPPAGPDEECSWWWTVRNAQRRRRDELLWEGWATRSEVADIALEAVVAVKEASGAAEPKPTPKPKPKPKPTRSPTVTRSKSKAAPIDLSAVPLPDRARIEALVKRLDTPEVRAVTGRGVTAERVLGMALERGLAALEHDLGTR